MNLATSPASIAVVQGLADALRVGLRGREEQLDLFPETIPLPQATRVALAALIVKANTMPAGAGPRLAALELLKAIESDRHPEPESTIFRAPARVHRLRVLATGLACTQSMHASNAQRVADKLARFEAQGLRAAEWKNRNPACHPWGVPGAPPHRLRGELYRRLLEPVGSRMSGWRRETVALGCIRYVLDPVQKRAFVETLGESGKWEKSDTTWNLGAHFKTGHWLPVFVAATFKVGAASNGLSGPGFSEYERLIRDEVEASGLMPMFAEAVAEAIGLEPEITALARSIAPPMGVWVTDSDDYSAAWQDRDAWEGLVRENADLAILLRALNREYFTPGTAAFQDLKALMLELGVGRTGWQFLCRHGRAAFELGLIHGQNGMAASVALQVRTFKRCPEAQPELVASLLGSVHLVNRAADLSIPARLVDLANAACIAAKASSRLDDFLDDEWLPVLAWFVEARPALHRNQWAGGWPCLLRAKDRWLEAQLSENSNPDWQSAIGNVEFGAFHVTPLVSRVQLRIEGVEMAHCVVDYAEGCLDGRYRIFSIRDGLTSKRKATLCIELNGGNWSVRQARGRANATITREVRAVVDHVLDLHRAVPGQRGKANRADDFEALLASLGD